MVWPFSSNSGTQDNRTSEATERSKILKDIREKAAANAADPAREEQRQKLVEAVNENCALEGAALLDCQDSWNLRNRLTLCQSFQKEYMECMNAQRVVTLLQC
jgi:hypothetical protein